MKRKCFVLMPFLAEHREVFEHAIKPAAENAGFECFRADDPVGPRNIVCDIVEALFNADAIVADLTSSNPNVFYELGIAHAIANKTIMICEKTNKRLPFDLAGYRTIFYERNIDGISKALRNDLETTLRALDSWALFWFSLNMTKGVIVLRWRCMLLLTVVTLVCTFHEPETRRA